MSGRGCDEVWAVQALTSLLAGVHVLAARCVWDTQQTAETTEKRL